MKKLKLKLDGVKEMLTREQMKKVIGGGYGGPGGPGCTWIGVGCNPCSDPCDFDSCSYSRSACKCISVLPCPFGDFYYTCPDQTCDRSYAIFCAAPDDIDHEKCTM